MYFGDVPPVLRSVVALLRTEERRRASTLSTQQKWAGLVTKTLQSDTTLSFFPPPCVSGRGEGKVLSAGTKEIARFGDAAVRLYARHGHAPGWPR